MNYIISQDNNKIELHLENEFAKAYFSVLYQAKMQGAFNVPDDITRNRLNRFIDNVCLQLGLVEQLPEMEATPDPPPQMNMNQTIFVNGQPMQQ